MDSILQIGSHFSHPASHCFKCDFHSTVVSRTLGICMDSIMQSAYILAILLATAPSMQGFGLRFRGEGGLESRGGVKNRDCFISQI
jgi:hypothetical protein